MELIEIVADPQRAREVLIALGVSHQSVEVAPPRDPDDDGCQIVPGNPEL